jgi:serine/threonine protein phosphatase PrpC
MAAPRVQAFAGGEVAFFTTSSPDREDPQANEDGAALVALGPRRGVIAVADGLGGQPGGAAASENALRALVETLGGTDPGAESLRGPILDGMERADEAIRALGIGAATTLVVAEVDEGRLRSYHVGDSGMLLVGQRGRVKLQTVAHSPVGYGLEAGLLDEDEAFHHEDRHVVSNWVGSGHMRIEVGSARELALRDTLLLATDGLFDNLAVAEITDRIRTGPLDAVAAGLARRCRARMAGEEDGPSKPDDLTFALFRPGAPRRRKGAAREDGEARS